MKYNKELARSKPSRNNAIKTSTNTNFPPDLKSQFVSTVPRREYWKMFDTIFSMLIGLFVLILSIGVVVILLNQYVLSYIPYYIKDNLFHQMFLLLFIFLSCSVLYIFFDIICYCVLYLTGLLYSLYKSEDLFLLCVTIAWIYYILYIDPPK